VQERSNEKQSYYLSVSRADIKPLYGQDRAVSKTSRGIDIVTFLLERIFVFGEFPSALSPLAFT
jgi:hypothetical protein